VPLASGVSHQEKNAMNGMELTPSDWLALIRHIKQWVGNLGRAGKERKKQSKKALRAVLLAVRETEAYVTDLNEGHPQSRGREREISSLWSSLAFELEDLDLNKLAKVCRIKGKYWATRRQDGTSAFTEDFLKKAGTRLSDIESAANLALKQVNG
jgi:hypothetical protein